jgi:magnesium chelatase accessory protein
MPKPIPWPPQLLPPHVNKQMSSTPLNWEHEGRDWPHRQSSKFIQAAGLRWHVQVMTPDKSRGIAILIHGTGASTHSWRDVMPLLAKQYEVVAIDLPGHGYTQQPAQQPNDSGYSLTAMAGSLQGLLRVMKLSPTIVIGHSAGAAILLRMVIDKKITPAHIISINGALLPLTGLPGEVFSPIAKFISRSQVVPKLFAWRAADPKVLNRLLDATGSTLDETGRALYGTLITNAAHASAALNMMANWDLQPLENDLAKFSNCQARLSLIVGENDKTVSPKEADRVQHIFAKHKLSYMLNIIRLPKLGHLAHEESPDEMVKQIVKLVS